MVNGYHADVTTSDMGFNGYRGFPFNVITVHTFSRQPP